MTDINLFSLNNLRSLLDILLVAFAFYQVISMLRGTRAVQIIVGLVVIFIIYVFSGVFKLDTLNGIIHNFSSSFIVVIIILFQDDIRRILTKIGTGSLLSSNEEGAFSSVIDEVCKAISSLSRDRIGAIIVFERDVNLGKLYTRSVELKARVSEKLLISIFQSFSPLHDGAVIIKNNRIDCASAHLPLSKSSKVFEKLGTRHSAGIGISEESDAVVVIVSEETAGISIAWEGNLKKQQSAEDTKNMLSILLLPRGESYTFLQKIKYRFLRRRVKKIKTQLSQKKKDMLHSQDGLPLHVSLKLEKKTKDQSINVGQIISSEDSILHDEQDKNETRPAKAQEDNSKDKTQNNSPSSQPSVSEQIETASPSKIPQNTVTIGGVTLDPPKENDNKEKKDNSDG